MQVYYFTRTGRSKKITEELAERYETKAQEIADDVDWQGAMGYLKAGYEAFKNETRPARYNRPVADEELLRSFLFGPALFHLQSGAFLKGKAGLKLSVCLLLSAAS